MIIILETAQGKQSAPLSIPGAVGPTFRAPLPPFPSSVWGPWDQRCVSKVQTADFKQTQECLPVLIEDTFVTATIYRQESDDE